MGPTSWLEINLSRIDGNLACFRELLSAGSGAITETVSAQGAESLRGAASPPAPALVTAAPARALRHAATLAPRRELEAGPVRVAAAPHPVAGSTSTPPGGAVGRRGTPLLCGVVKADAYGLGVLPIAQRLASRGIDMLAVYSPAQAEHLATATLHCPILVLMRMSELGRGDPLYRHALTGRLHLSIHDRGQLQELEHAGRMLGCKIPVHLYIDTGMSRAGLSIEELPSVLPELAVMRHLRVAGIYTHLTSSESDSSATDEQLARLDAAIAAHRSVLPPPGDVLVHVGNTCATLRNPNYHRGMVRVGLGLYGFGPEQMGKAGLALASGRRLQHAVRWLSRVIHVQRYAKGVAVGYGSTVRLSRDSVLGLVPVGYADGYALSLSGSSSVGVLETAFPPPGISSTGAAGSMPSPSGAARLGKVLGRVNMDQIVVDLTDSPNAGVGTVVELISDDADSLVAAAVGQDGKLELLRNALPALAAGPAAICVGRCGAVILGD